jgi:hypothetical protein
MNMMLIHGRESDRLERAISSAPTLTAEEANSQFRLVHWHGYAATYYYEAASRPWISLQADPALPYCICKYCQARPWLPPETLRVPDPAGKAL